ATKEVAVSEDTASSFKPGMPTIAGMDNVVEFNDLTLTATADSNDKRPVSTYRWSINGNVVQDTNSDTLTYKAPGYDVNNPNLEVSVVVVDSAGKESAAATKEVAVSEDTASSFKPGMPTIAGMDNVVEFNDLTLTATADSNDKRPVSTYRWSINGNVVQDTNSDTLTYKAPGYDVNNPNLEVSVVVVDSAGKESEAATKEVAVSVDSSISGPTNVSLTAPNKAKEGSQITLTASATVANGRKIKSYTWTVGNNTQTTTDPSYQVTIPSYDVDNPNLKVKVKVTDSANKTAESTESSIGIEVDTTIAGPTNVSLTAPSAVQEGSQVRLTASATVANGRKVKAYEWTVDGGNVVTTTDPNYEFTAIDVVDDKNQTVSLVVVDSAGARSQAYTKNVMIKANILPSVTLPRPSQVDDHGMSNIVSRLNIYSTDAHARFDVDSVSGELRMTCDAGYTAKSSERTTVARVTLSIDTGIYTHRSESRLTGLRVLQTGTSLMVYGGCKKY
ncbi:hypothetical protein IBE10_09255, partial [Francisella tularensis subsp. novicida]|nr:hypothetical protein [Francisella tularensis subsp. novicida]